MPSILTIKNVMKKRLSGTFCWLNKKSYSMCCIAEVVDISKSTVLYIIKRINGKGAPNSRHSNGSSKKLDERCPERIMRKEPIASYNQTHAELWIPEIHIPRATLIRYIRAQDFGSYFTTHKPRLNEDHMKMRVRWAKE